MEIKDETREMEEDYTEERQEDIFFTLLSGKTVTEKIETSRGAFTVKFPKQKDIIAIDRRIAFMRGGIPAESFDAVGNFNLQKVATLDVMVEGGPRWFDNLRERNRNWSWGEVPDAGFVDEVYAKAYEFRLNVQGKFGKNEEEAHSAVPDGEDVQAPVGDGLFSGVAAKSGGV